MNSFRTAIYVLSSVVVALVGLVVTVTSSSKPVGLSIGTSLVAAGIASLAFAIMRFLDDASVDSVGAKTAAALEEVHRAIAQHQSAIDALRRATLSQGVRADSRAYGIYPGEAIEDEVRRATGNLEVDSFGLTLGRLSRIHLDGMLSRSEGRIRLLVQDPRREPFDLILRQEQRDREQCLRDIASVTRKVYDENRARQSSGSTASVELRWYRGYPTSTTIRIDDTILARTRLPKEPLQMNAFYERYIPEDGRPYVTYLDLFESMWTESTEPTLTDVTEVEALISGDANLGQDINEVAGE